MVMPKDLSDGSIPVPTVNDALGTLPGRNSTNFAHLAIQMREQQVVNFEWLLEALVIAQNQRTALEAELESRPTYDDLNRARDAQLRAEALLEQAKKLARYKRLPSEVAAVIGYESKPIISDLDDCTIIDMGPLQFKIYIGSGGKCYMSMNDLRRRVQEQVFALDDQGVEQEAMRELKLTYHAMVDGKEVASLYLTDEQMSWVFGEL